MKIRMAVLSVSMFGLAACASSGGTTSYKTSNAPAEQYAQTDNDEQYMARVEAAARRRGIHLTWVNPPRKVVARQK